MGGGGTVTEKQNFVELFETIPHPQRLYPDLFVDKLFCSGVTIHKEGRWIEEIIPDGYEQKRSRTVKRCSVCEWTNACRYNFCPNCGAKMTAGK